MDFLVIVGFPLVAVLAAVVFGVLTPRWRRSRRGRGPVIVVPFSSPSDLPARPLRTPPSNLVPGGGHAPDATRTPPLSRHPMAATPQFAPAREPQIAPQREAATGTHGGARHELRPSTVPGLDARPAAEPPLRLEHVEPRIPDTRTPPLRVHRPAAAEGTLQFLPGRFEIVEGRDVGQEIRFVKQPGSSKTEITFGRSDGVPYRHVQLHEPTVSRLHAKVTLEEKRWRLANLSTTNPVIVNGRPLEGEGASHLLAEGDRVELGEVAMRFRAK